MAAKAVETSTLPERHQRRHISMFAIQSNPSAKSRTDCTSLRAAAAGRPVDTAAKTCAAEGLLAFVESLDPKPTRQTCLQPLPCCIEEVQNQPKLIR